MFAALLMDWFRRNLLACRQAARPVDVVRTDGHTAGNAVPTRTRDGGSRPVGVMPVAVPSFVGVRRRPGPRSFPQGPGWSRPDYSSPWRSV